MKIKILKIEPGKKPEIKEIEDGLKSLQDEVQGDIEAVYPFDDNVGIICNYHSRRRRPELLRRLPRQKNERKVFNVEAHDTMYPRQP